MRSLIGWLFDSKCGGRAAGFALLGAAVLLAPESRADDGKLGPTDPIAGWTDGTPYLRSPGNNFVLFPSGRLQIDGYGFVRPTDDMPHDSLLLRRARLELNGWIGSWVYFSIAGDFASGAPAAADPAPQTWIATTDNYVGLAPLGDRVILQAGQFDAPFTLENRTSDKYFDFMERSLTVRTFGIPSNKEVGMMVHGLPLANKGLYYSVGVFNGDGQNFRNVDDNFDVMARAWVAPFAFTEIDALKSVTFGGSVWTGKRGSTGLALNTQSTQGGFAFLSPKWTLADGKTSAEMHQIGDITAYALEANVPVAHRFGLRFELVHKSQGIEEDDISAASSGKLTPLGKGTLEGTSFYGEAWGWLIGDDRIIGEPGLQMPTRLKKLADPTPQHGLMVAARIEDLQEKITTDTPALNNPNVGTIHVIAPELGVNYWYSKRFRATFNYAVNLFQGDTANIAKAKEKNGGGAGEHELMFRLGIAL
ncbi:MAG: porin [Polyangiaceae bacterium]